MILTLGRGMAGASYGRSSLRMAITSCVFDLDATQAASYPGAGQSWRNLVIHPADGSAREAYDFALGAGPTPATDDPGFTGPMGTQGAYFALDGGDNLTLQSGVNTPFLNALHKTTGGVDFWFAMAFRAVDEDVSSIMAATASSGSTRGILFLYRNDKKIRFGQRGDGASAFGSLSATLTPGADYLAVYSYSNGTLRSWLNSTTKTTEAVAFDPTSADASGRFSIASYSNGASKMKNGTRLYAVSMGNGFIDDADVAKLVATYNRRHGRVYA